MHKLIKHAKLSTTQKSALFNRLDSNVAEAFKTKALPNDYKAIILLHTPHRNNLAIPGELLARQGFALLTVWQQHCSDALLPTNAGNHPQTATWQLKNAPRNAQNGWLSVSSVEWIDTAQSIRITDALFSMLQDAINKSGNTAWKQQAQRVLNDAVQAVTTPWDGNRDWQRKTDPTLTDSQLQKVRKILIGKPK